MFSSQDSLREKLSEALDLANVVITSGGVSMGEKVSFVVILQVKLLLILGYVEASFGRRF